MVHNFVRRFKVWKFLQQKTFPYNHFTGKLDRTGNSYTLHSQIEKDALPNDEATQAYVARTWAMDSHPNLTMVTANGHATLFSRWHSHFHRQLVYILASRHFFFSAENIMNLLCAAKWQVKLMSGGVANASACLRKLKKIFSDGLGEIYVKILNYKNFLAFGMSR